MSIQKIDTYNAVPSAILQNAVCRGAVIKNLNLSGIELHGLVANNLSIMGSRVPVIKKSSVTNIALFGSELSRISRTQACNITMSECKIGSYLFGNSIQDAQFTRLFVSDVHNRRWKRVVGQNIFERARFAYSTFGDSFFTRSKFVSCFFERSMLSMASFDRRTSFCDCRFDSCIMPSVLNGSQFVNCEAESCITIALDTYRRSIDRVFFSLSSKPIKVLIVLRAADPVIGNVTGQGTMHELFISNHHGHDYCVCIVEDAVGSQVKCIGLDASKSLGKVIESIAQSYFEWNLEKLVVTVDGADCAELVERISSALQARPTCWSLPK